MQLSHLRIARALGSAMLVAASVAQAGAAAGAPSAASAPPTRESYQRIGAAVEKCLQDDDLKKFFPASIDNTNGGYFQNFGEDWTHGVMRGRGNMARAGGAPATGAAPATSPANGPTAGGGRPGGFGGGFGRGGGADTSRSIVYQARLTWLASQAAMRYPAQKDEYLKDAKHGADFLMTKQWDSTHGGWWWEVNATSGQPTPQRADDKHMYGEGFAIYALAAYYAVSKDPAALDSARKGFAWIEDHAHDAINGGYYEQLKGDGNHNTNSSNDVIGTKGGLKSMNAHIHLLEAFTGLLEVDPDNALLRRRTEELYQINLTKIYYAPGALHMFFNQDWSPVGDEDSYGHDIEAAYLYAEAAKALGKPDDPACWKAGKAIVDHCMKVAIDPANGFLYGTGTLEAPKPGNLEWWVEAESMNALLLMHQKYGHDDPKYWNAFVKQWNFNQEHFVDKANGGWYKGVNSTNLAATHGPKTDSWTEGYHQGRSMLHVTEMLKELADAQ